MNDSIERHEQGENEERLETMHILHRLEEGQIDVDEAERLLSTEATPEEDPSPTPKPELPTRWESWWLIPFGIGVGLTAAGAGVANLGGWWWLCAGPLLLVGILLLTASAATSRSPWVHVRIYEGKDVRPTRFAISLPIPVRFSAWVFRNFGHYIKGLDETGVDELLVALDSLEDEISRESPLVVQIEDDEDGERIEVFIG
ncbi:MAG: hypothetical protein GTO14_19475 [Anaerolineales bacterium]|nr:hypothetical protein [Anaerolineales bacterium]